MKKTLMTIAVIFLTAISYTNVYADTPINASDLPTSSQDFLTTHFPGVSISTAEADDDGYDVDLANGFEIEFNKNGEWTKIDGKRKSIPVSIVGILPDGIDTYVSKHYAGEDIVKVKVNRSVYEVETSKTRKELVFNKKGKFLRVDY